MDLLLRLYSYSTCPRLYATTYAPTELPHAAERAAVILHRDHAVKLNLKFFRKAVAVPPSCLGSSDYPDRAPA